LHEKATTKIAGDFLRRLIAAVPYKIHTVLTDNGIQFTTPGAGGSAVSEIKEAMATGELFRAHAFELACAKNDIDHRLTKPKHPWTNGQVERMNRTIKEATVQRFYYESHQQLCQHLADRCLQLRSKTEDSEASRPSSTFAKSGLPTQNDSFSTRSS
jgi:transposase InsO family protein